MAKDPAVLFYIDKWLLATKEMKPDCKAWYHSLILHHYDKKSLPNDIEELANLADVRFSEFEHFKQVFEQVLKHKFKLNEQGRLINDFANEIITNREQFKDKRSNAGKMSYFAKFMRKICTDENIIQYVLKHTDFEKLDTKNEQMLKQVFEQKSKLYISVNVIADTSEDLNNYTIEYIEELKTKKNELTVLLCEKFGYSEMRFSDKQRLISAFVSVKILDDTDYDNFIIQFNSYDQYKKLSEEKRHAPEKLIGTQSEQFKDSVLLSENWEARLENYKIQKPKSKFEKVADNHNAKNPYAS